MNTKRVTTAADVILAALTQNRTAAGIALALESVGMLSVQPAPTDVLAKARNQAWQELRRDTGDSRTMWRTVITDSESPTGLAPVCSGKRSDALHMIEDYPGGPQRDEDGVYDCCPYPQIETYSTVWAEYLAGLLNADASDELAGAYLARWEEEQDNARLRLALKSAQRGRRDVRAELYGEQAQHRTTLEQRNAHARELLELRPRVAELEAASQQLGDRWRARCDHIAKQGLRWKSEAEGRKKHGKKLQALVAELEAAPTTAYRAEHPDSGITLGHYGTEAAARAHCEAEELNSWGPGHTLVFDWIEDEEDRVAELVVTAGQCDESTTGYLVTALDIASEYDEEADQ
ncbi:hypothetical protein ACFVGN_05745 [Streptomyces sp. NPDC057757]|uniref:hypothetical protein n=1 Tax=Streptomyces sp. NPDC057757 TaxID=3346241 RepID=UPI00368CFFD3